MFDWFPAIHTTDNWLFPASDVTMPGLYCTDRDIVDINNIRLKYGKKYQT